MHQQHLGRQAAVDRPLRRGRLHDITCACPAAAARAADDSHPKFNWKIVKHFRDILAYLMQQRIAACAGPAGKYATISTVCNAPAQLYRLAAVTVKGGQDTAGIRARHLDRSRRVHNESRA